MESSRYSFAVMSTGRRPEKTTEPQFVVTTTKGNFKINGAASRLMGLQHGDHAALVNNEEALVRAKEAGEVEDTEEVTWAIMKGGVDYDANGVAKKSVKRLTKEEEAQLIEDGEVDDEGNAATQYEDKMVGFKLAATNKAAGLGNTLQGSDAVNYVPLGGNPDKNIVYEIGVEPQSIDINGTEVDIFILGASSEVDKMKRG